MKYNRQTPCVYQKLKVVYHGIPKNASTSVKNALYEYEHGHEFQGSKQWVHKGNEKGGSLYPEVECIKTKFNDWLHLTVVRNPFSRFISFYSDLFAGTTNLRHNIPPFYVDNNIVLEPKPIDDVIDIIESYDDENADEHFSSQSSFVHFQPIEVLKLEELETSWKLITDKIQVDYKPLNVYNRSDDTFELSENQKQRIYNRYKQDFIAFNYSYEVDDGKV